MKERNISYFKKTLVVLMAMIMVFTYMPGMACQFDLFVGRDQTYFSDLLKVFVQRSGFAVGNLFGDFKSAGIGISAKRNS